MLRLVTVFRPVKAIIFYSGHPDVCTVIKIMMMMMMMMKIPFLSRE